MKIQMRIQIQTHHRHEVAAYHQPNANGLGKL
jgi:hypothetical protein